MPSFKDIPSLNWKTEELDWEDLPQVTDSYVVHARGFVVKDDLWLDKYSVKVSHNRLWSYALEEHYLMENWKTDDILAFQITGSPTINIVWPKERTDEMYTKLTRLAEALDIPMDTTIYLNDDSFTIERCYYEHNN